MKALNIIAFAGASNWPLWVGQRFGFFSDEGINLVVKLTPNSLQMAEAIAADAAQVALTSIDNVIAYANGQGEAPLTASIDLFAFMGVDNGLLSVMAQPNLDEVSALRGHVLAVDAPTTGFSFVLREILRRNGVSEAEVTYRSFGSGAERLAALRAGLCNATLLNAPLCLAAESDGNKRLARAEDVLGGYQGVVGAARRCWAQKNPNLLTAFVRSYYAGLTWLCEPANKMTACRILKDSLPVLGHVTDRAYDVLITKGGLQKTLEIDLAGTACVIALRNRYASAAANLGRPEGYIDDMFRQAALAQGLNPRIQLS